MTTTVSRGQIVLTTSVIRGEGFTLIPPGCFCTVVQVDQAGTRCLYLLEINGITAWAEDSEFSSEDADGN